MRRAILAGALAGVVILAASAGLAAEGPDLSLKEIIQKNLDASGGRDKLGQVKSLSFRTGDTRCVVASTGELKLSTGKDPVITEVILVKGGKAQRNSFGTITDVADPDKTVYQTLARLYAGLFTLVKFESELKLEGIEAYGPEKLYHLTLTEIGGIRVSFYLRADDFRLKRLVYQGKTADGDVYESNIDFGTFEAVEGYELPLSWFTSRVGTRGTLAEVSDLQLNPPLSKDLFSRLDVNIGSTEAQGGLLKGNVLEFNSNRYGLSASTNWGKSDVEKAGFRTGDRLTLMVEGLESEIVFYATSAEVPNPNETTQGLRVMTLPWFGETYALQFVGVDTAAIASKLKPLLPIEVKKK